MRSTLGPPETRQSPEVVFKVWNEKVTLWTFVLVVILSRKGRDREREDTPIRRTLDGRFNLRTYQNSTKKGFGPKLEDVNHGSPEPKETKGVYPKTG